MAEGLVPALVDALLGLARVLQINVGRPVIRQPDWALFQLSSDAEEKPPGMCVCSPSRVSGPGVAQVLAVFGPRCYALVQCRVTGSLCPKCGEGPLYRGRAAGEQALLSFS